MSTTLGPAPHLAHHVLDLRTRRLESVLAELARHAASHGAACEPELLAATLLLRERVGSTAAGHGVAIPNARSLLVTRPVMILGHSRRDLDWGADDGPVRTVIAVLSPAALRSAQHVAEVARVAESARLVRTRQRLVECAGPAELARLVGGAA